MRRKTLFLDLGGVVVSLETRLAIEEMSRLARLSPQEVRRRMEEKADIARYERGEEETAEFFRRLEGIFGLAGEARRLARIWCRIFPEAQPKGFISAPFFGELGRHFHLVALSNTNPMHFEYLRRHHPLVGRFHDYLLSYQVGSLKPEAPIFERALEQSRGAPPPLFVDDRLENVEAARQAGLEALLFEGEAGLRETLARRGYLAEPAPTGAVETFPCDDC